MNLKQKLTHSQAWEWTAPEKNADLTAKIAELATEQVNEAYQITEKAARYEKVAEIRNERC